MKRGHGRRRMLMYQYSLELCETILSRQEKQMYQLPLKQKAQPMTSSSRQTALAQARSLKLNQKVLQVIGLQHLGPS